MLVDIYWWNDVLVDLLNWCVGWRWLMLWPGGWCVGLVCWLTLSDALACLLCVESTCWFFNCFSRCNRGLLRFFIKETRKKELHIHYLFKVDWKQTSFCCAVRWNKKTRHGLNRGMMYYIPVKQALKRI